MDLFDELRHLLDDVLQLQGRALSFTPDTALLGALPELDSMAVVSLLAALEARYGLNIEVGDLDGSRFATLQALHDFVLQLRQAQR
ncbi:acyl carrier protein [Roseateles sp. BYS180W]|uniref:Acyl carrier protein n=1 Tax=Roseateles rivi TaxID=3299028 RepID=A0ABW7FXS8_9BURK